MKRLFALLLALLMVVGLAACGNGGTEAPPAATPGTAGPAQPTEPGDDGDRPVLRIGATFTLSGGWAATGSDQREAMMMFLEDRNMQLGPYDVEIWVEDDEGSVETGLARARMLVEAHDVHFLFGSHAANVGYAIGEYAVSVGIPYIIPCVAADDLTQRDAHDLLIRTGWGASQAMHPFGYWAAQEAGFERIAMMGFDMAFAHETAAGFARTFEENGGEIVTRVWTPIGTTDFVPFLSQIPRDVDAVWFQYMGVEPNRVFTTFRDMGFDMPILAGSIMTDEHALFELDEDAALNYPHGTYSINHWVETSPAPYVRAFADAFYERVGRRASYYAMESYAGFQLIEAAINEAGGFIDNFDAFLDAIRSTEVVTAKGRVIIDEWNNPVQDFHVRRVERVEERGGELANVLVRTFPQVSQFWIYDPLEFLALPLYGRDFDTAEHNRLLEELRG